MDSVETLQLIGLLIVLFLPLAMAAAIVESGLGRRVIEFLKGAAK